MGKTSSPGPIPRLRRVLPHKWGRPSGPGPIPRLRRVLPHEWGRPSGPGPIPRLRRVLPHKWGRALPFSVCDGAPDFEPAVVVEEASAARGQGFELLLPLVEVRGPAEVGLAVDDDIAA